MNCPSCCRCLPSVKLAIHTNNPISSVECLLRAAYSGPTPGDNPATPGEFPHQGICIRKQRASARIALGRGRMPRLLSGLISNRGSLLGRGDALRPEGLAPEPREGPPYPPPPSRICGRAPKGSEALRLRITKITDPPPRSRPVEAAPPKPMLPRSSAPPGAEREWLSTCCCLPSRTRS